MLFDREGGALGTCRTTPGIALEASAGAQCIPVSFTKVGAGAASRNCRGAVPAPSLRRAQPIQSGRAWRGPVRSGFGVLSQLGWRREDSRQAAGRGLSQVGVQPWSSGVGRLLLIHPLPVLPVLCLPFSFKECPWCLLEPQFVCIHCTVSAGLAPPQGRIHPAPWSRRRPLQKAAQ